MKIFALVVFVATAFVWPAGDARAGRDVAAIVEQVVGSIRGSQPMELLEVGRVIKLGKGAAITLGYLRSCIRETVTGGSVTIGRHKSKVINGTRRTEKVDCDGGVVVKSTKRKNDVAGAVFRKGDFSGAKLPKPQWTLYGTKPILRMSNPTKLIAITRLDKKGSNPIVVPVIGDQVDMAQSGILLAPGGLYAVSDFSTTFVLKVSPLAVENAPLLSRLVLM